MLQFCWGIYFLLDLLWMVYPNWLFCNMYVIKLTFVCKIHLSRIMGSSFGFSRSNFEAHSIQFYNTFIFLTNIYSLAFSSNFQMFYIVTVLFFINILSKLHNLIMSETYAFQFLNLILWVNHILISLSTHSKANPEKSEFMF